MKKTAYRAKTQQEFDTLIDDLIKKGCTLPAEGLFDYFNEKTIVHIDEKLSISVGFIVGDGYKLIEE